MPDNSLWPCVAAARKSLLALQANAPVCQGPYGTDRKPGGGHGAIFWRSRICYCPFPIGVGTWSSYFPARLQAQRRAGSIEEDSDVNPQERDVINQIFDRLQQAENQPRDPEAEALIRERLAAQPGAAYLLAQIVHVQEQALTNLNDRVNALEAEAEQARAAPQSGGGGFLSSLFGGSTPPAAQARPAQGSAQRPGQRPAGAHPAAGRPGPAAGPWGGQQGAQPGAQQPGPWGNRAAGGGGFLASAMTTAAGVAGGLVLGNVLMNAFSGGTDAATPAADQSAAADQTAGQEDVAQDAGYDDATYQDASYDEGLDGGFDDFGGGDDWA
nr:DUF2076 domain-containing protein [Pseudochelatococcus contaminans]